MGEAPRELRSASVDLPDFVESDPVRRSDLLHWLAAPARDHGIDFVDDEDGCESYTYADIARGVASVTQLLAGVEQGTVCLLFPTGVRFVTGFFGALAAGDTPCPLAPPGFFEDDQQYRRKLTAILGVARPVVVLAEDDLVDVARQAAADAGLEHEPLVTALPAGDELCGGGAGVERREHAELALLQFTSGSTGRPRGARVTWPNLQANVRAIGDLLDVRPDDSAASWLPLHHDMGLIGALITIVVEQVKLRIMRPDQFVRWPERWIHCFGKHGATLGVGPTFGFAFAAKRIKPQALDGCDFSRWRAAIVGADRVEPGALGRFSTLLGPYGFKPSTFVPAYGLAEATLMVSHVRPEDVPNAVLPDWSRFRMGERVETLATGSLDRPDEFGRTPGWLTSCGRPVSGVTVTIVDDEGAPLPDGHLGEIVVEGESVVDGYEGGEGGGSSSISEGILSTGDAGFVLDGSLYVVGRLGDSMKIRGRNVFAEDLEAQLRSVPGVPAGRSVIFTGASGQGSTLVVLVEAPDADWVEPARRVLEDAVGDEVSVVVLVGSTGAIQRTSSGKPRRRAMWEAYLRGEFEAQERRREEEAAA